MNDVLSIGWPTIILVGFVGLALATVGVKFFKRIRNDEKDAFGARPTERLGFLTLNGLVLLFAAIVVAILKFSIRG